MHWLSRVLLPLAISAGIASADPIVSNLDGTSTFGTGIGGSASTQFKAGGFTMGSRAYRLDTVTIDIDGIGNAPFQADLQLWSGAGTPTTFVATLGGPALTSSGEYTFTPTTEVILAAGQTYWVYANNTTQGEYRWVGRASLPAGPAATSAGYIFNGSPSTTFNALAVEGTPILIDNLSATPNDVTFFGAGFPTAFKAAGFRLGNQSQIFEGVVLDILSGPGNIRADVQLWAGNAAPQVQVATLSGPLFTGNGLYTFVPDAPIILTGDTTYWIYVANTFPDPFSWQARNAQPSGIGATSAGYLINGNPSSSTNAYAVLARPIPEVISNIGTTFSNGTLVNSNLSFKAAGFTMGESSYDLCDVELVIGNPTPGTIAFVEIWSGNNGPVQRLTTLAARTLDDSGIYSFAAAVPFELTAGVTYWVLVPGTPSGQFNWSASTVNPSGAGATFVGYLANGLPSSVRSAFAINGFEVIDVSCSPADLSSPTNPGSADGVLTGADFFEFLARFQAGNLSVDYSSPTMPGVPDGVLSGADFFEFLNLFAAGC